MEGPRALRQGELASLGRLVDVVFQGTEQGKMLQQFPGFLCEDNRENLLVFGDNGRIVSHFGMTHRWASLGGAAVKVALVGAVATYEEYRGKGLATRLFEAARAKAIGEGADFMLISGGRGLYRRVGAADVGFDHKAAITRETAARLADDVDVRLFHREDLRFCTAAYGRRATRFVRPLDDWHTLLDSGYCACRLCDVVVAEKAGVFCGYFVAARPDKNGVSAVLEYAGDETVLPGALGGLIELMKADTLELHIPAEDAAFRLRLEKAGVELKPAIMPGTLLILNFQQLAERLRPYIQTRVGHEAEEAFSFRQDGDSYTFSDGTVSCTVEGAMEAAKFLFGASEVRPESGRLAEAFPAPTLVYGANYV